MKPTEKNIVKIVSDEFIKFIRTEPSDNVHYTLATSSNTVLIRQDKSVDDPESVVKNIYLNISYKTFPMANVSVRILNGHAPKLSIEYNVHHPQYLINNQCLDGLDYKRVSQLVFDLQQIATEISMQA